MSQSFVRCISPNGQSEMDHGKGISAEKTNRLKVDLINADLKTAMTFAQIASQSMDKEVRARRKARMAFDSAVHYISTATLTQAEHEDITTKVELLKSILGGLGESF